MHGSRRLMLYVVSAALVGVLIAGLGPSATGAPKREVTIRAAVRADASGPDRAVNLKRAAERLNAKLTDVTINLQLEEAPSPGWAEETWRSWWALRPSVRRVNWKSSSYFCVTRRKSQPCWRW